MNDLVVVSDLDDTLYNEIDYKISGITYVLEYFKIISNNKWSVKFDIEVLSNSKDWINDLEVTFIREFRPSREEILWLYRNHIPIISLRYGVIDFLLQLDLQKIPFCILTDGRSVTQRNKIHALGLCDYWCLISAEHDSEKPNTKRFQYVMDRYSASKYIYIGDNTVKDFITPHRLGWDMVLIKDVNSKNIHQQDIEAYNRVYPEGFIADNFVNVSSIVRNIAD